MMLTTITTCYFLFINIFSVITTKSKEHVTPSYFNDKTIHTSELEVKAKKLLSIYKNHRDSLDFSFISGNQSIHIWTKDFKSFKGTLTNFTFQVPKTNNDDIYKRKHPKHLKKYKKTVKIDPEVAKKVYTIFNDADIFTMPDGNNIKDWRIGTDGITYSIIYSTPSEKSTKEYWTPQVYVGKIKEADTLVNLVNQLEATLNMRDSYRRFFDTLPDGCYNVSSIIIWCKEKKQ